MSDRASRALAERDLPGEPRTYDAISKRSSVPISTLNHRALGRPSIVVKAQGQLYLNPLEEEALAKYLILMADLGNPVRIKFLASLAFVIRRQRSATNNEAIKPPGKNWAQGFQKRYPELKSRRVRAIDWKHHENNIYDKIIYWFEVIEKVLQDPAILPENVYNMDETGVMLCMLGSVKVLIRTICETTEVPANGKPRVLICDGFGTHETLEILEFCFENNIILCRLPSHTSHKLQPCDVGAFAPLKAAYRGEVERLFQGGVNTVGKEHFTLLYSRARDKAFSKRNITGAWAATGLFPLNRDRVLRRTPKPLDQLNISRPDEMGGDSGLPDEVPQTPTTPVSAEAFISLHNLIKQDTSTRDETSIPRVQRRVDKLANAGQKAIAYCALLEHEKQLLKKINSEAKVRRSTKSIVLGKGQGKVMSFEDIEVARAARAAKDVVKGKRKRGRKRKSTTSEEGKPDPDPEPGPEPEPELEPEAGLETGLEPEPEMARAAKKGRKGTGKRARKRTSIANAAQPEPTPEPVSELAGNIPLETWSAPVAQMY